MLPSSWKRVIVDEVCDSISVGIVVKPTKYYVHDNRGVRAFRSANVREGRVENSNWVHISVEGHKLNRKSELQPGDVLVVRTGYPGTACVVTEEFAGSNAIDIVIARPNQQLVVPEYLCAFTNSSLGKSQVLNLQGGMAQKHLNVGAYKKLRLQLPPIHEQKEITRILSTWDQAIETTKKLIENSKTQKKALMQQLLTGKKRLPGVSGEWSETVLKNIAAVLVSPVNKKSVAGESSVRLCNYTDVYYHSHITNDLDFMTATASNSEIERFTLKKNDLIITKDSETPGDIAVPALVTEKLDGVVCGYHLAIIRPDTKVVDGAFLNHLFSQPKVRHYFSTRANGATRFGLTIDGIKEAFFMLPEIDEQQKIASVLNACDQELRYLNIVAQQLTTEKRALMQQLLTGKRRVKVAA